MFKRKTVTLSDGKQVTPPFNYNWIIMAFITLLIWGSAKVTNFDLGVLIARREQFLVLILRMFPIDFSYIPTIIPPMIATIAMSLVGTIFAAFLALPISYFCAENLFENTIARNILRVSFSIFRTIPILIIALILTYIFGLGTFAGTAALLVFTFSIIVKMTYEQLELVDMGPFEAMLSMGSPRFTAFWVSIIPQVLGFYISTVYYNLEVNVRSATMLGFVGAGGIGLLLKEKIGWRQYPQLGAILFIMFLVVIAIESVSKRVRRSLL